MSALPSSIQQRIRAWSDGASRYDASSFANKVGPAVQSVYRAGQYSIESPELRLLIKDAPKDILDYVKVHRRRLEVTFQTLRDLRLAPGARQLVDLGSWEPYVPMLRQIFPDLALVCAGEPGDIASAKSVDGVSWFGLDLESERLPVEDNSTAVVLLLEVIEHFYQDPMFALAEAHRILQPGGVLVLSTPNLASFRALVAILTQWSPYTYGKYTPGYPPHVHEYVPRELAEVLKHAGFDPKVWTANVYSSEMPALIRDWLGHNGFETDDRGDTIFAVATKSSAPGERYPSVIYDGRPNGLLKRDFELREKIRVD